MENARSPKATLSLASAFLLFTVAGFEDIWGSVSPYIASYHHYYNPEVTYTDISIGLPMTYVGSLLGLLTAPVLQNSIGLKPMLSLAMAFLILGAGSLVVTVNSLLAISLHGLLVGFGCGTVIVSAVWPAWSYFPHLKGRITGILFVGYSLGAAIYGLLIPLMANPQNLTAETQNGELYFPLEVIENFPSVILYLTCGLIALSAFCISGISINPNTVPESKTESEFSYTKLAKSWPFWKLFLTCYFAYIYCMFIVGNTKDMGLHFINNDFVISLANSISRGVCILGRFVWPLLLDRFSYRQVMSTAITVYLVFGAALPFIMSDPVGFTIGTSVLLFTSASYYPALLVRCGELYKSNGPKVFGLVCISVTLSIVTVYFVTILVKESLGYVVGCLGMVGICSFSLLLVQIEDKRVVKSELLEPLMEA